MIFVIAPIQILSTLYPRRSPPYVVTTGCSSGGIWPETPRFAGRKAGSTRMWLEGWRVNVADVADVADVAGS